MLTLQITIIWPIISTLSYFPCIVIIIVEICDFIGMRLFFINKILYGSSLKIFKNYKPFLKIWRYQEVWIKNFLTSESLSMAHKVWATPFWTYNPTWKPRLGKPVILKRLIVPSINIKVTKKSTWRFNNK